jgi:type 1 fimbriae regulatory protein FimB/type 1 fimbriae regulatory protein FimE
MDSTYRNIGRKTQTLASRRGRSREGREHCVSGPSPYAPARAGLLLANAGHDTRAIQLYLGHKNIQHTVRYTELASVRFKDFWRN